MPRYPKPKQALPKHESCGAEAKPGCTTRSKKARRFKQHRARNYGERMSGRYLT